MTGCHKHSASLIDGYGGTAASLGSPIAAADAAASAEAARDSTTFVNATALGLDPMAAVAASTSATQMELSITIGRTRPIPT